MTTAGWVTWAVPSSRPEPTGLRHGILVLSIGGGWRASGLRPCQKATSEHVIGSLKPTRRDLRFKVLSRSSSLNDRNENSVEKQT